MGIFKRTRAKPPVTTTQIRSADAHPFGMLDSYVPLGGGDIRLYRAIGMAYTGTAPTLGYAKLASDANGGVKVSASGREYLVVEVDTVNKTVEFAL